MNEERLSWLAFSAFKGIGPKKFALLKNYFGSAQKAWQAREGELLAIGLGPKLASQLVKFRRDFNPDSYFLRLRENEIECYFLDDNRYPESLKKIDSPPFVLYGKGTISPRDKLAMAVVGTRRMTNYGSQVTENLVSQLVKAGLTIISGLARGVDSLAHRVALRTGGRTIGVLACGLDLVYPPENLGLVREITNGHGSVVSEFPLGTKPIPENFPARNRLISGLSLGTLVIEAPKKSGTLITACHAAEQGREVFAVSGPITSANAAGPAYLIKMGAKLVFEVNDILEELGLDKENKIKGLKEIISENPEEEMILALLKDQAKSINNLVQESGFDSGQVMKLISLMEIKGQVENLGNMLYSIKK